MHCWRQHPPQCPLLPSGLVHLHGMSKGQEVQDRRRTGYPEVTDREVLEKGHQRIFTRMEECMWRTSFQDIQLAADDDRTASLPILVHIDAHA
jgi:hypothetical protein